ncbi:Mobile element protein (plasmid) [Sinorhizobium alkalisoli]|nr:Mobile element protein [Sinorhizobium alkalisoli]
MRIGQLDRSGRGLAPAKMGGHVKPMLRGAAADAVHRRLAAKTDWTVRALAADPGSMSLMTPFGVSCAAKARHLKKR